MVLAAAGGKFYVHVILGSLGIFKRVTKLLSHISNVKSDNFVKLFKTVNLSVSHCQVFPTKSWWM